jgi:RNA polymerase sigma-70 factor (ECF subfamily)
MRQAGKADAETDVRSIEPNDFDWIVMHHQKRIYRVLLAVVRDSDTAEVLTQECFLRAYRKRGSFRGDSSLATWLMRIAVNLAHDYRKNRRRAFWRKFCSMEQMGHATVRDAQRSPEQAVLDAEMMAKVQFAVDRLPERQRIVFLLRFIEEMSLDEIACATGLETGTVKTHLYRAVRAVRRACGR